jgi:polyribonucleotide nucleotidyltransferase
VNRAAHHHVPKEKIREVIGTGGKVIREIVEQTGCKIDIEDDGTIKIAATDDEAGRDRLDPRHRGRAGVGAIYTARS